MVNLFHLFFLRFFFSLVHNELIWVVDREYYALIRSIYYIQKLLSLLRTNVCVIYKVQCTSLFLGCAFFLPFFSPFMSFLYFSLHFLYLRFANLSIFFHDFLPRFPVGRCPHFDNIYIRVCDAREKLSLDTANIVLFLSREEWTDVGKSAQISLWRSRFILTIFELTLLKYSLVTFLIKYHVTQIRYVIFLCNS